MIKGVNSKLDKIEQITQITITCRKLKNIQNYKSLQYTKVYKLQQSTIYNE